MDFKKRTNYLVCKDLSTEKYRLAIQKGVYRVKIDWLFESKKAGYFIKPDSFTLKPFEGLKFSIIGKKPNQEIKLNMELQGADYAEAENFVSLSEPILVIVNQVENE